MTTILNYYSNNNNSLLSIALETRRQSLVSVKVFELSAGCRLSAASGDPVKRPFCGN